MCLFTKDKEARIALEDITVYKVMHVSKNDDVVCGTPPFQRTYVYRPGLNIPQRKAAAPEKLSPEDDWYSVREGCLHAYTYAEAADSAVEELKTCSPKQFSVVKMYIPAGTPYYMGDDCDVASEALYWPEEDVNA